MSEPKATTEVYWIVSMECQETRYMDGSVATPDRHRVWLGWSNEAGGWPSCEREKARAYRFSHLPTVREIARWDGMPWWYHFKPGTQQVLKITTTTFDPIVVEETITAPSPVTLAGEGHDV